LPLLSIAPQSVASSPPKMRWTRSVASPGSVPPLRFRSPHVAARAAAIAVARKAIATLTAVAAAGDEDVGALGNESPRGCEANPAATAGDHGHLVLQLHEASSTRGSAFNRLAAMLLVKRAWPP
jgi:hypothetical protein